MNSMTKLLQKGIALLAVVLLTVLVLLPAQICRADPAGIIEISAKAVNTDKEQPIAGVEMSLYKIADKDPSSGYGFSMTEEFRDSGVKVEDFVDLKDASKLAASLQKYALKNSLKEQASATTDSEGKISFSGLEDGIYMVIQTNTQDDFTRLKYRMVMKPFLTAIPKIEEGEEIRQISCEPKCYYYELSPDKTKLTVYKLWKDDNNFRNKRPDSIRVGLYKDGKLQEQVNLSKANNWRYAWNKLSGSHKWTVRELSAVDSYTSAVTHEGNSWTITNTYTYYSTPFSTPKTGDRKDLLLSCILAFVAIALMLSSRYKKKR